MKNLIRSILFCGSTISILTMMSCELNINTSDDCLECSYTTEGRTVTEELCETYGTDEEQTAMRDRMQNEADELDTELTCKRY